MVGPIVVFFVVCTIVAVYMSIVHSFLGASEQVDGNEAPAPRAPRTNPGEVRPIQHAPGEQWAH